MRSVSRSARAVTAATRTSGTPHSRKTDRRDWRTSLAYPVLRPFTEDELREHFVLGPEDRELLEGLRKEGTQLGFAVLLKAYRFLGYPPTHARDIPGLVVEWLAGQLGMSSAVFDRYRWRGRVWMDHLAQLRSRFQMRPFERTDRVDLAAWLADRGEGLLTRSEWLQAAVVRLRDLRIELPQQRELRRLVRSVRKRFEQDLFRRLSERIEDEMRRRLDELLDTADSGTSKFDWLKSPPGKPGKKSFLEEARRQELLNSFQLDRTRHLGALSERRFRHLRNRVRAEDASLMRRHPPEVRCVLLAVWLCARRMEGADHLVSYFMVLIKKVGRNGREELKEEIDLLRVFGTRRLLHRLVGAGRRQPDLPIGAVMLEELGQDTLQALYLEMDGKQQSLEAAEAEKVQRKFAGYRAMVAPMLKALDFRTGHPKRRMLLEALDLVARHATSRHTYLPEEIPQEILTEAWRESVIEEGPNGPRVIRKAFELCVLTQLEEALKCKEVWVEGSYRFRDPDQDLPGDWEERRGHYYGRMGLPRSSSAFVQMLQSELTEALKAADRAQQRRGANDAGPCIRRTAGGKASLHVPTPTKRPERPILDEIKVHVGRKFRILDLLDVLVEVDRRVNLVAHFHTSGDRRVLGADEVRRRLLLVLFGLGTNLGLQRIHSAAKPDCSYDDLRYFLRKYVTPEALRQANVALVNHILELRDPSVWGQGTACASDGRYLAAWDRNPVAEWNPHYPGRGVLVYWHVERGAVAIHSRLKKPSSTEVAPMIEGVVHHGTVAAIESNCVDSRGQSLPAFGFSRPLRFDLMPRFRQVRKLKLYLPCSSMAAELTGLEGVTTRAIRWDLIEERYDDFARHAAAILERTGPVESVLRRFTRYNRPHPTYRALLELGRVERTLYLCKLLSDPGLHVLVNDQLNGIETWNSCNRFICFGRRSELRTNDPVMQELVVGALHLLQNAMVLANTLMVERVLTAEGIATRMEDEDFRALTPLFTSSINPYGYFELDLDKPSFLEAS